MRVLNILQVLLVILLLLSGMLKRYVNLPVDFTLLTFILALIATILIKPSINSKALNIILWLLPFSLFYLLTMVYSPSNNYSILKAGKFLMGIVSLLITTIVLSKENAFNYFKYIYKLVFIILISLLSFFYFSGQFSIVFLSGDLTLAPDYLSISAFLATSVFLFLKDRGIVNYILKIGALLAILILGGRGPFVISVLLLVIYYSTILIKGSFLKNLIVYSVVVFTLFMLSVEFSLHERTFDRLASLVVDPTDSYLNPRYPMWVFAWESFLDKPLIGHGIGSFGLHFLNIDMRAYPHNLVLEILFESGLVGLALLLIFGIRLFKFLNFANVHLELKLILVFFLLDFMKSNSIEDLRVFLMWIGIVLVSFVSTQYNDELSEPKANQSL